MKNKSNYQSIREDIAQAFVDIYYKDEPWEWIGDNTGSCIHVYRFDIAYHDVKNMLEALRLLPEKDVLLAYNEHCSDLFEKEIEDFPSLEFFMQKTKPISVDKH